MEVLEQLRHEAERRASTPEGLLALADLLLKDLNEILDATPEPQLCFIGIQHLADFFGWIQAQDRAVYSLDFCKADYDTLFNPYNGLLKPQVEYHDGKVYLWAAEMCHNPQQRTPGEVKAMDANGIYHYRQWWPNPKARLFDLLKVYVLAKRQLEYFEKRNKILRISGSPASQVDPAQMKSLKTTIEYQRAMVEKLSLTVPAKNMAQWKKEIGPRITYGFGFWKYPAY